MITRTGERPTLVLGGTGKTGRRIVDRLRRRGLPVRVGSRSAAPAFDWEAPATWGPALSGAGALYLSYYPDLAVPGAVDTVQSLLDAAVAAGLHNVVLLSGRGEDEAERAEDVLRRTTLRWTIVRSAWFCQNFNEGYLCDGVCAGELMLPATTVGEPFVDADDIADVATAALTSTGHEGRLYDVTGPRLLTFEQAVEEISRAVGRKIRYRGVDRAPYLDSLRDQGVPPDVASLLDYLFGTVLDGRNSRVGQGVPQALGRPARDFAEFARDAAAAGAWRVPSESMPRVDAAARP